MEDVTRDGNGDELVVMMKTRKWMEHEESEEITDILSMEEGDFLDCKERNLFTTTASVVFHIHCSLFSTNLITATFLSS